METPDLIASLQARYRKNMLDQKERAWWTAKTDAEQAKITAALEALNASVPQRRGRRPKAISR